MPPPPTPSTALAAGKDALERGAWPEARTSFQGALEAAGLAFDEGGPVPEWPGDGASPPWLAGAYEGYGLACYWLDATRAATEAHELAYRLYRSSDRPADAARMAIWLCDDHMTFYGAVAVARGWLERAASLLEPLDPVPEHAWLSVYRGHLALQADGDAAAAVRHAQKAEAVSESIGSPEPGLVARALHGLALVSEGEVKEGMPRLDEASARAIARDVDDFNAVAWTCCYLIHGCEAVRDFPRAGDWCRRVKAFAERWGLSPIFGTCRTHYASILTWRGQWREAELELRSAMSDAELSRPAMVRSGLARLAELKRRQGFHDEAEALLEEAGGHPLGLVSRAYLALDHGKAELAADLARRYLRRIPRENRARRVDGLVALARASSTLGDKAAVAAAATELREIADAVGTEPLRGGASLSEGLVSRLRGDEEGAREAFEDAVDLYESGAVPFEAATARKLLAESARRLGRRETALREARRTLDAFRALGASFEERLAASLVEELEAVPESAPQAGTARDDHPLSGRELEVLRLVARGRTNTEIAEALFLSPHTVKRHVANILTKLDVPTRSAAVGWAAGNGILTDRDA
jgi:ATP/maltotriose-dependent transcriptional regulator MalT